MIPPTAAELLTAADLGLAARPCLGPPLDPNALIRAATSDSRQAGPGVVFAALKGAQADGADYLAQAAQAGASAALVSLAGAIKGLAKGPTPPLILCDDPRRVYAEICARLAGPSPQIVSAVTGSNGKTSVAEFTRQIWEAQGVGAATVGTLGLRGPGLLDPRGLTTPDPADLHGALARLAAMGAKAATVEASSHGLDQRRLDGVRLASGAFTNLTRDHLDYHGSMEEYAAAKLRLFTHLLEPGAAAAINLDDPIGAVAAQLAAQRGLNVIGVGRSETADLRLLDARPTATGMDLSVQGPAGARSIALPLIGGFQAMNALTAWGLVVGAGGDPEAAFDALTILTGVRGRMEQAAVWNGAGVYVDYAHTPDAVANALTAIRPHAAGRVIAIIGAGGDRDPGKRPMMGAAAAKGADIVLVTDDNPRSEDPAAIRAAVMAGAGPDARDIPGRAEAIHVGVSMLTPGDVLLIAGKGHEQGQEIMGESHPFDDATEARAAVEALS